MADRYSDIMRAAQLKKAYDNYMKYLQGEVDRQANIGQGTAKPPTTPLYVIPFGTTLGTKQFAQVSGNATFWNNNKAKFTGYTKDDLDTTAPAETALKLKGFRSSRLSYKSGIKATGDVKTSNVTKMKYLNYGGTSTSVPFGNKTTPVTESAAFSDLKSKFTIDATSRVYWQREKY